MDRSIYRTIALLAVVVALLGACGDDDPGAADATSRPGDGGSVTTQPADADDEGDGDEDGDEDAVATSVSAGDCAPGPGKTVTEIDDVVIPAVDIPAFTSDDTTLGGDPVPGIEVDAVHIPERVIEAGCIIEYDAPGGCLGAVEITGYEIPDVEIPGYEVATVRADGETIEGTKVDGQQADGTVVDGVRAEQVCQQEPADGEGYVSSVYRSSLYRSSGYRSSLYRSSAYRSSACTGGTTECIDSVSVPSASVPSVDVPSVSFDSAQLDSYTLEGSEAEVFQDEEETAYLAPADVLFDYGESELRPDAVPTLQAVADAIAADFPGGMVTVEGHTDAKGETADNQRLSEERAAAVAAWLTSQGGIAADRIATAGYGEDAPAAPNTNDDGSDSPEGRAKNRRVVISVRPAG